MSVSLLIVAHAPLGDTILGVVLGTLGKNPMRTEVLDIEQDCEPDAIRKKTRRLIDELDDGDGVLVLTDIYGSTPSNIACALLDRQDVRIVTGLNVPMLFRVMNYARLDLNALTEKAVSGGQDGVTLHDPLSTGDFCQNA